ncbi:MAG: dTMP kinase [Mycobacteriales bacterium]
MTTVAPSGGATASGPAVASQLERIRGVLRIRDFRLLWISLAASSLGDWLGLLAKTAMATALAHSYQAANFALGGVLVTQLLPAVLLAPFAGVIADRFDRRHTMVGCDLARFAVFVTIPLVGTLTWLFVASFIVECFAVFWRPAKEASVPRLLQRTDQLETANQLSLITTYGITPIGAAALFSILAGLTRWLGGHWHSVAGQQINIAMYLNAATFLVAALTVFTIMTIGGRPATPAGRAPGPVLLIREGAQFVGGTPLIRGLVVGILGAFAAGGVIIGTGRIYAQSLGGGDAAYGMLFGAIFVGLGLGMTFGPRVARDLARVRLFGVSIVLSGGSLVLVAISPLLIISIITVVLTGFFAGIAYLTGMTLLGSEVDDEIRGRTFAFVQSMVQVVLIATLAVVPFLVGVTQRHRVHLGGFTATIDGSRVLLAAGGVLALVVGIAAYRQMDDRRSAPFLADLIAAVRRDTTARRRLTTQGIFIAFEGGEGAGKSTQLRLLAGWLRDRGHTVVETHEPGGTELGQRLRSMLLHEDSDLSPRTEALLFAADRADHVSAVIRPALDAGGIVLTDRYVDSSLAYQGGGRDIPLAEIRQLQRWATSDLQPDLTVLLDIDPAVGLQRARQRADADRIEASPGAFHQRVRQAFRSLAEGNPSRYLVLDAGRPAEDIQESIRGAVTTLLLTTDASGPPTG